MRDVRTLGSSGKKERAKEKEREHKTFTVNICSMVLSPATFTVKSFTQPVGRETGKLLYVGPDVLWF